MRGGADVRSRGWGDRRVLEDGCQRAEERAERSARREAARDANHLPSARLYEPAERLARGHRNDVGAAIQGRARGRDRLGGAAAVGDRDDEVPRPDPAWQFRGAIDDRRGAQGITPNASARLPPIAEPPSAVIVAEAGGVPLAPPSAAAPAA